MKSVLFVCIENACRSQMAEGLARSLADFPLRVASAGTRPAAWVDQNAVAVMAEIGIDISKQRPSAIDLEKVGEYDYVITMGCGTDGICPAGFIGVNEDWEIPDPKGGKISQFRHVRDLVRLRVERILDKVAHEGK